VQVGLVLGGEFAFGCAVGDELEVAGGGLGVAGVGARVAFGLKGFEAGVVGTVSARGRTKQSMRMSWYAEPPPSVAMMWA
jgi:hypothetical protein